MVCVPVRNLPATVFQLTVGFLALFPSVEPPFVSAQVRLRASLIHKHRPVLATRHRDALPHLRLDHRQHVVVRRYVARMVLNVVQDTVQGLVMLQLMRQHDVVDLVGHGSVAPFVISTYERAGSVDLVGHGLHLHVGFWLLGRFCRPRWTRGGWTGSIEKPPPQDCRPRRTMSPAIAVLPVRTVRLFDFWWIFDHSVPESDTKRIGILSTKYAFSLGNNDPSTSSGDEMRRLSIYESIPPLSRTVSATVKATRFANFLYDPGAFSVASTITSLLQSLSLRIGSCAPGLQSLPLPYLYIP